MWLKGCREQDLIFIGVIHSGHQPLGSRIPVVADNTPSHACGYRFRSVVRHALVRDGEGQVAESIAELAS